MRTANEFEQLQTMILSVPRADRLDDLQVDINPLFYMVAAMPDIGCKKRYHIVQSLSEFKLGKFDSVTQEYVYCYIIQSHGLVDAIDNVHITCDNSACRFSGGYVDIYSVVPSTSDRLGAIPPPEVPIAAATDFEVTVPADKAPITTMEWKPYITMRTKTQPTQPVVCSVTYDGITLSTSARLTIGRMGWDKTQFVDSSGAMYVGYNRKPQMSGGRGVTA